MDSYSKNKLTFFPIERDGFLLSSTVEDYSDFFYGIKPQ